MNCDYSPYTLPTIDFVAGETQELVFHLYSNKNKTPFALYECECNFSVVGFNNKFGAPLITKYMDIAKVGYEEIDNILKVTLLPTETLDLNGKYIYQITIRDHDGVVEIPKQGILYVTNNINKDFIRRM